MAAAVSRHTPMAIECVRDVFTGSPADGRVLCDPVALSTRPLTWGYSACVADCRRGRVGSPPRVAQRASLGGTCRAARVATTVRRGALVRCPVRQHTTTARTLMGSVIKKRRKRMAKKKHRKLLRKTRHQRRNKK
ncbi:hypothetical protein GCM10027080_13620 [Pedococcus soli]